ncbi:Pro-resilin [Portunus trituberculatus]|uniref:Pro-resilin n=1 Tax=Portunus trituberculatus TaxID=210409 RepID=A0A5B7KDN5_PORTR|nr:Pro-resilin [Portunus trituberculatus]
MPFVYSWKVLDDPTANDYSHSTNSDGDLTTGEYRVLLPDGRTQVVTYTSSLSTGYVAEVRARKSNLT